MPVLPFDMGVPLQNALELFFAAPQDRSTASTSPGTTAPRMYDGPAHPLATRAVLGFESPLPPSPLPSKEGPPDAIVLVLTTIAEPIAEQQNTANFIPAVPHSISTFAAANAVLGASIVHLVVPIHPGHPLSIVLLYRQHDHRERESRTMPFYLFGTTKFTAAIHRKPPHAPSKSPSSAG
ncbi:hypothetical protein FIBSPDRAFT_964708 [Athelia psychrophila]|uniref:Uncharacterized protein n=1 Tax=Athelia psychrophila TaxID=1759441 RepID=A0A165XHD8_9AGAM|nr:hypothetical protein FIBSPDRAFT_964708 [Fibularhizoctonia sp. CBS 109695]